MSSAKEALETCRARSAKAQRTQNEETEKAQLDLELDFEQVKAQREAQRERTSRSPSRLDVVIFNDDGLELDPAAPS